MSLLFLLNPKFCNWGLLIDANPDAVRKKKKEAKQVIFTKKQAITEELEKKIEDFKDFSAKQKIAIEQEDRRLLDHLAKIQYKLAQQILDMNEEEEAAIFLLM